MFLSVVWGVAWIVSWRAEKEKKGWKQERLLFATKGLLYGRLNSSRCIFDVNGA